MAIKLIAFLCPPESSAVKVGQGVFCLRIMVPVLSSGVAVAQHLCSGCRIDRAATQLSSSSLSISVQINH